LRATTCQVFQLHPRRQMETPFIFSRDQSSNLIMPLCLWRWSAIHSTPGPLTRRLERYEVQRHARLPQRHPCLALTRVLSRDLVDLPEKIVSTETGDRAPLRRRLLRHANSRPASPLRAITASMVFSAGRVARGASRGRQGSGFNVSLVAAGHDPHDKNSGPDCRPHLLRRAGRPQHISRGSGKIQRE